MATLSPAPTAVSLGGLLSARLLALVMGHSPACIDDRRFVDTWVAMVHSQITDDSTKGPG